MLYINKLSTYITLCLIIMFIFQTGCNKDDTSSGFIPHPNPDTIPDDTLPEWHYGWHESMVGKILYTQRFSVPGEGFHDHLFVKNSSGTEEIDLPETIIYIDYGVEWSPDCSRITFGDWNNGLFVMDNDGANTAILYDEHACRSPSWSPDGSLIAFAAGHDRIVVLDPENGNYNSIIFPNAPWTIDWSPVGPEIAMGFGGGMSQPSLKVYNTVDSSITTLVSSIARYPVWSPNGEKIAYSVNSISSTRIYTVNKDGSDITLLIFFQDYHVSIYCLDIAWSPDSEMIAVAARDGIYIVKLSGEILTKLKNPECYNLDWQY